MLRVTRSPAKMMLSSSAGLTSSGVGTMARAGGWYRQRFDSRITSDCWTTYAEPINPTKTTRKNRIKRPSVSRARKRAFSPIGNQPNPSHIVYELRGISIVQFTFLGSNQAVSAEKGHFLILNLVSWSWEGCLFNRMKAVYASLITQQNFCEAISWVDDNLETRVSIFLLLTE